MFLTLLICTSPPTYASLYVKRYDDNDEEYDKNSGDTSIEKDHLGDQSPEKDFCWQLTFQQPVQKPSSESSDSFSQLKIQKPWWAIW